MAGQVWRHGLHGRVMRSMIPRVDASLISEMKDMAEENRRLKRMYAEMSMQNDLLKEALGKSVKAVSASRTCRDIAAQRAAGQRMARDAVVRHGVGIASACRAFHPNIDTSYRLPGSGWNGPRNARFDWNTSSRASHNKMPTLNATTAPFAANGLGKTSSKPSRRRNTKQPNGSGLTTTSDPTWASATSHPP